MHVRFIFRDPATVLPYMICSAELVLDEGDGPLAGLWLMGFELWRGGERGIAVSLPFCPIGAPREWWYYEYLRGRPEATARLKAFFIDAYENRGALWTCPVCRTLARARDHESSILDTLHTLDRPIPPPLRRVPKRRARKL